MVLDPEFRSFLRRELSDALEGLLVMVERSLPADCGSDYTPTECDAKCHGADICRNIKKVNQTIEFLQNL